MENDRFEVCPFLSGECRQIYASNNDIYACGVKISSRFGRISETLSMVAFCEALTEAYLLEHVISMFCDSQISSYDIFLGSSVNTVRFASGRLLLLAEKHFDVFNIIIKHENHDELIFSSH